MIFSFAERLVLVTYAGRLKFQGKKEQSYLRSNPALLMQAKLPFASPKIAAWHTSKWEFCHKDNLIVQVHYVPEGWKPFAGTRNLLWPGKDRGLHKKRHFLRVGDQKLMGSSSSPSKSEAGSKMSLAATMKSVTKAQVCPTDGNERDADLGAGWAKGDSLAAIKITYSRVCFQN